MRSIGGIIVAEYEILVSDIENMIWNMKKNSQINKR